MWSISWWESARQRLRLSCCELLVGGSRPARAQGTHLSHPQAEHPQRARSYHGIEGQNLRPVVTLLACTLPGQPTPEATDVEHQLVGERSTASAARALQAARWQLGDRDSARDSLEPSSGYRICGSRPASCSLAARGPRELPVQPAPEATRPPPEWGISWWGSARQRLRLSYSGCELFVGGSRPARAQGTHLSPPQAEHLKRARCEHGIEGRNSEASGHVTCSHAAGAASA